MPKTDIPVTASEAEVQKNSYRLLCQGKMSKKDYDYSTRDRIYPISWDDFHGICKALAQAVSAYQPEIIIPVGRGGYYPGTLLAHILQVEVYPVRLSRRINDQIIFQQPQWRVEPPALVKGRRVLIVDEVCSQGETLRMVKEKVKTLRVGAVRSAVMYAHSWGISEPDYIGLITDALILNPWDREILKEGAFQFHPEYVKALGQQNIEADKSLLIETPTVRLAKG